MSDSTYVAQLLQVGIAAAKAGRKGAARQALLKVTELDERNEQAWLWLSGVVDSLEDRRICLENVLAINPGNTHAQAGLAWLDQQQAPPASTAQDYCPRCQSPVPLSKTACVRCGQMLIVACPGCFQYVDVREVECPHCGRTLEDFRGGARYYLALARAYQERRRYDLVQEAAARAEAEAAADPEVLGEIAVLHEEIGYTDRAIAVYQRALERDPGNALFYARLGAIYRRRRMPEARAMYERAAERAGENPAVLFELAQVYLDDGETTQGLGLLQRIVRLDPDHAEAHSILGDLYLAQGQRTGAIQCYERASALFPPDTLRGREVRLKLNKLRPALLERQAQGWGETVRLMGGLMLAPVLAALVNARLVPWQIGPLEWVALALATVGSFLWVSATEVTRNPAMRAFFGPAGVKGRGLQALVGLPGTLLWAAAFGLILWKL